MLKERKDKKMRRVQTRTAQKLQGRDNKHSDREKGPQWATGHHLYRSTSKLCITNLGGAASSIATTVNPED